MRGADARKQPVKLAQKHLHHASPPSAQTADVQANTDHANHHLGLRPNFRRHCKITAEGVHKDRTQPTVLSMRVQRQRAGRGGSSRPTSNHGTPGRRNSLWTRIPHGRMHSEHSGMPGACRKLAEATPFLWDQLGSTGIQPYSGRTLNSRFKLGPIVSETGQHNSILRKGHACGVPFLNA